jgi:hypothetical protein
VRAADVLPSRHGNYGAKDPVAAIREEQVRHWSSSARPDRNVLTSRLGPSYPTRRLASSSRTAGTKSIGTSIAVCVVDS